MVHLSFDLRLLGAFVVLAEEDLHFRVAADRLGIGQPGLSRQLARLEQQLRTTLVRRNSRHKTLTPAGARFLNDGRAALQCAHALVAELDASSDTIRIHMGHGVHRGAQEVVGAFMRAYPTTRVEIVEGQSSDVRGALLRHRVDVAFELRSACLPGMRFELLERAPLGLLSSWGHPAARTGSVSWDDLVGERILFGPAADGLWNALVRACLADAGVVVTEDIPPLQGKLHYVAPLISTGVRSMITGLALFDPLPSGLTWTALTPYRHLEYGLTWDPRRGGDAVRRLVDFTREYAAYPGRAASGTEDAAALDGVGRRELDLRLLPPFVTVGEELHFGRAAAKLVIAQPALSRQVARLESQLDVRLLERTSRSTSLTEAGRLTLAAGREILDKALRAERSVAPETAVGGRGPRP